VLSGELGVSQAFLARWYIGGGYIDVSEVVVFMTVLSVITKKYGGWRQSSTQSKCRHWLESTLNFRL